MRSLVLLLAALLLAPLLPVEAVGPAPPAVPVAVPRPPILVLGDVGFLNLAASGVVGGSGTASDPYVIQGWDIATFGAADGIRLEGTRAHVVLRNNVVHEGDPGWPTQECYRGLSIQCQETLFPPPTNGIVLVDAQNVTIDSNLLYRNGDALRLERSEAVVRNTHLVGKGHPPLTQGCQDLGQQLADRVTSLPWPRLVQNLGLVPWKYFTHPPLGIVALDSDLDVQQVTIDCVAAGLVAVNGRTVVRDSGVADAIDGFVFAGGQADARGVRAHNTTHAGVTLGWGTQATVVGANVAVMGRGVYVCGEGTVARVEDSAFRDAVYDNAGAVGAFVMGTPGCPGAPHLDFVDNVVERTYAGLLWADATGSILDNQFLGGPWYGVYTQFASPYVAGNTITGYTQGLLLRWHHGLAEGNVVTGNEVGATVFGNPSIIPGPKPALHGNALHGNARWDLANSEDAIFSMDLAPGTVPVDATGNWWGQATGPQPGQVRGAALVEPWATSPG